MVSSYRSSGGSKGPYAPPPHLDAKKYNFFEKRVDFWKKRGKKGGLPGKFFKISVKISI